MVPLQRLTLNWSKLVIVLSVGFSGAATLLGLVYRSCPESVYSALLWRRSVPDIPRGYYRSRGQLDARSELDRGHYAVLTYGYPAPWSREWARLLRERYGIEERTVSGCLVTQSLVAYVEGYNGVSMAEANRKFGWEGLGRDVFQESAVDAERNWRLRRCRGEGGRLAEWAFEPVSNVNLGVVDFGGFKICAEGG